MRAQNYDQVMIEQTFSLSAIKPPFEAGGTCDAVELIFEKRLLEVPDLKTGWVSSKSTRTSRRAPTRCAPFSDCPRRHPPNQDVKSTIIQPRAPHKDGRTGPRRSPLSPTCSTGPIDLLDRMSLSHEAFDEFETIGGNKILFEEWCEKWLTTGQCKFCKAEGFCPKLRKEALARVPAIAAKWFEEPDMPEPDLSNTPRVASPEELARFSGRFEMLKASSKPCAPMRTSRPKRRRDPRLSARRQDRQPGVAATRQTTLALRNVSSSRKNRFSKRRFAVTGADRENSRRQAQSRNRAAGSSAGTRHQFGRCE